MKELVFQRNAETAAPMEKYMKHLFVFAGVPSPERKLLSKEIIKESKKLSFDELFDWIAYYYQKDEREYHYVAIDLALANVKRFSLDELLQFKEFVILNAWWDSVDSWRKLFGVWSLENCDQLLSVFEAFYGEENFWHRRIAINLQLQFKQQTNQELLKKAIIYDRNTEEFFIQKAIGWSLREYSKTNPEWVQAMIQQENLSKLAVREGSKYLLK